LFSKHKIRSNLFCFHHFAICWVWMVVMMMKWRWWWWRWLRKGWWWWWWITVVNDGYDDERRCWWWDWRFQWWWWRTTVMEAVIEDSGGVERRWWTFGLVFNWSVERFVCLIMLSHCLMNGLDLCMVHKESLCMITTPAGLDVAPISLVSEKTKSTHQLESWGDENSKLKWNNFKLIEKLKQLGCNFLINHKLA